MLKASTGEGTKSEMSRMKLRRNGIYMHAKWARLRHHMFDFPSFHIRIVLESSTEETKKEKRKEKHPKNILIHENEPFPSINFNKTICRLTNLNWKKNFFLVLSFGFFFWQIRHFQLVFVCCDRKKSDEHRFCVDRRVGKVVKSCLMWNSVDFFNGLFAFLEHQI